MAGTRAGNSARNHAAAGPEPVVQGTPFIYDVATPVCVRETCSGNGVTSRDKPVIEKAKRVGVRHLWRERDKENRQKCGSFTPKR